MSHARKRKPVRPVRRPSARHSKPAPQRQPTQAIVVRPPAPKPWILEPDEIELYRKRVCKGATDEEFKYCLTVARRYELDPFQGQIFFVPKYDNAEGGGKQFVPIVGINGLCYQAASHNADFGTFGRPEYGPTITVKWKWKGQGQEHTLRVPEWCVVKAFKKGIAEPSYGEVWWEEIYRNIDFSPTVRQMPRLMLAKCAKAQVIRLSYPKKTGGLLIQEETLGTKEFVQFTPEGRYFETPADKQEQKEYWCSKHNCDIKHCPSEDHTQEENEQLDLLNRERNLTTEQRAVADRKRSEARDSRTDTSAKSEGGASDVANQESAALHYQPQGGTSTLYLITGPNELKAKIKIFVRDNRLYYPKTGEILCNAALLGKLIRFCEENKVPLRALREPGDE